MANFVQAIRLNKLPVVGLVPEKSGTAPSAPVTGQLWCDTSVTPNVVRFYDGTTWQPWVQIGTTAGTAADASTVVLKANNLSDLANITTARTNLGLGTAATTNTGTGATNTILGSDARLSDTRTPTAGSVVDASVAAGAAIAESKLALATDAAAGVGSRRTLSITSTTAAMPGGTRLDQIATSNPATAPVDFNSQRGINVGAPVNPNDVARLIDVQNSAAGIDSKPSVRLLATTQRALTGLAAIDGVTPVAGDRILLAGQTAPAENGVYIAAAGAWARAGDSINPNSTWFVEEGTANHDTVWWVTTDGAIVVGTTALVISQFSGGATYTAGTGIALSAGQISISGTYAGQASITTVGTLVAGALGAGFTTITVAQGGTGATTAAAARTNLGAPQLGYAATLGAVAAGTPLTVTHNLGTQDVIAQVRDASTNEYVYLDVINASANTVTITAGVAYGANALRIVVIPVA